MGFATGTIPLTSNWDPVQIFFTYPVTVNSYNVTYPYQQQISKYDIFERVSLKPDLDVNSEGKEIWVNFLRPEIQKVKVWIKDRRYGHHSWRSFGRGPLFRLAR